MALAASSLTQMRYIEESVWGTTPNSGNGINLRMTGESLAFNLSKTESAEIRSDRQTTDLILVGADANGGINFEMSYLEYDKLLEGALWSTFTATAGTGGVSSALSIAATAPSAGVHGGTLTGTGLPVLAKGQFFLLRMPSSPNDGLVLRAHGVTASTSSTITLDESTPVVVQAATPASTISSSRMTNGATAKSFTLEKNFTDITQFFAYRGMMVSKFSMKIASGSITSGSFEFMGKNSLRQATTTLPGSPVASKTHDVQNGVTGVSTVLEGGVPLVGTFIKSLDLSIDNSLRALDGIGNLGSVAVNPGTIKVTGTIEVYLKDGTLYDKFLNNTTTSIVVATKDTSGNGYAFTMPAVKYGDAKVQAGGKDQDIVISMPFTAIMDPVTGKTLIVDRYGVAAA